MKIKYLCAICICLFIQITVSYAQPSGGPPYTFEKLEKQIKQSTYFDSVGVFEKGRLAIAIAEEEKNKSKVGLIYQYYGNYHYFSGRFDLAKKYYDSSIFFARSAGDSSLVITNKIRITYLELPDDTYQAERKFNTYLKTSIENKDFKNVFEANNALGILHEERQERTKALGYYYDALRAAEQLKDPYHEGIALNNIGLLKVRNQQYNDALIDFERGVVLADSLKEDRLAFNLHNNIGLLYYSEGTHELALTHYKETLKRARRLGFPYTRLIAYLNICNSLGLNNFYDEADEYADSALLLMTTINDSSNYPNLNFILADNRISQKKYPEALNLINKGLSFAKRKGDLYRQESALRLKSRVYELTKDFETALITFKQYHQLKDSLNTLNNKAQLAELQIAYETEIREAELIEERAKTEILKADNRIIANRIMYQTIIFSIAIFIIVIIFYMRSLRIKKKQQKYFSTEILRVLDEERSRIARDLHDDVGQSLSAVKSNIHLVKTGRNIGLDNIEESLGKVLDQTRRISHEIHPSYLSKIGLKNSISSLLENVEKTTQIITSCELSNNIDALSLDKQTQVYRILQECIANTIKHANAKSIKITIHDEKEQFKLIYRDNGIGITNKRSISEGIGMLTIKERSDVLNGKVHIGTNRTGGFRLSINFPK